MDNMACESWKREGRDKPKQKLIEYFIEHGYGQRHYSIEEIQMIFKEMDAIGMLYPKNAEASLIDEHTRWRESYHSYWFKKWFRKNKRDL
jgi:hemerythrin-like domain-containing protein